MARKNRVKFASLAPVKISYLEDEILRCFFPEAKEITIKTLLGRSGYSYERVNSALKSLKEKEIVYESNVGKTLIYTLNLGSLYSEFGFSHYMLERELELGRKYPQILESIDEIKGKYFEIILLFGSYSKDTETKESDIDLMIVTNNPDREKDIIGLNRRYGLNFKPLIIKVAEFSKIKSENPELWADLRKNAIVLEGDDWFYSWMYKNEKN